jgi:hypothetical protein
MDVEPPPAPSPTRALPAAPPRPVRMMPPMPDAVIRSRSEATASQFARVALDQIFAQNCPNFFRYICIYFA